MYFHLEIRTDNAGMQTAEDVAKALEGIAHSVRAGRDHARVMDVNGNSVGKWSLDLPEPDEDDQ